MTPPSKPPFQFGLAALFWGIAVFSWAVFLCVIHPVLLILVLPGSIAVTLMFADSVLSTAKAVAKKLNHRYPR